MEKDLINEEKRNEIRSELHLFNEAATSLEKKYGRITIDDRFCNLLHQRLDSSNAFEANENGGFVTPNIIKAKFQADYVIALRSLEMKNDFIFSADTDFAALLGNECLLIDDVKNNGVGLLKKKRKNKRVKGNNKKAEVIFDASAFEIKLAGVSKKKMIDLQKRLESYDTGRGIKSIAKGKVTWTRANRPLFEDRPLRLRALIALGLGCDVFDGVNRCGPSKIEKELEKIEKKILHPLRKLFSYFWKRSSKRLYRMKS